MTVDVEILTDSSSESSEMEGGRDSGAIGGDEDTDVGSPVVLDPKKRKRYLKSKERTQRTNHKIEFKLSVLDEHHRGDKICALAEKYKIPSNTISTWKKQEDKLRAMMRSGRDVGEHTRDRLSHYPEVDAALLTWFTNQREVHPDVALSGDIIAECARQ